MSQDISKKPVLAIISDTSMYRREEAFIFEPVLREISYFSGLFNNIIWLGFSRSIPPPSNAKKINGNNIKLLVVRPCGGNTYLKKLGIILFIPYYVFKIIRLVKKSDVIHTRGPSIPAMLTILISFFYPYKKYWHKYAGNWQLGSKALSYRFQKWLLMKKIPGKVIVSKKNNLDPPHILSWPNPCLTEKEIMINKEFGIKKIFSGKLTFCFVGRLEKSKGLSALLEAMDNLDKITWIDKLHCVGEIIDENIISKYSPSNKNSVVYHGILDRLELNKIYAESHFIILPSESEGFPKVLAEASSFGCIPIVPPIKSILFQINEEKQNGIVLKNTTPQEIKETIENLHYRRNEFPELSKKAMWDVEKFSYEKYNHRILNEIIQN